jgi:hypothetical protein
LWTRSRASHWIDGSYQVHGESDDSVPEEGLHAADLSKGLRLLGQGLLDQCWCDIGLGWWDEGCFCRFLRDRFYRCTAAVCKVYLSHLEALMGEGLRLGQDISQIVKYLQQLHQDQKTSLVKYMCRRQDLP